MLIIRNCTKGQWEPKGNEKRSGNDIKCLWRVGIEKCSREKDNKWWRGTR